MSTENFLIKYHLRKPRVRYESIIYNEHGQIQQIRNLDNYTNATFVGRAKDAPIPDERDN